MATRAQAMPWHVLLRGVCVSLTGGVLLTLIDGERPAWPYVFVNAASFTLFLFVFTVWHEAGHAIAARALGVRIWRIHVGYGRTFAKRTIGGLEWRFGVIPFGGMTLVLHESHAWLRLRHWLIIACGPLSNALALLALHPFGTEQPAQELAPLWAVHWANLLLMLGTLVPLRTSSNLGPTVTDGWQLLTTFFLPARHFAETRAMVHLAECEDAREKSDFSRALDACERGMALHPDSNALRTAKAVVLLEMKRFSDARALLLDVLADGALTTAQRLLVENNIAWVNTFLPDDALLAESDRLSANVVRRWPNTSWANGTRGAVLVRLGRFAAATEALKRAWETAVDDRSRAHNAAWLATAEALRGDASEARLWLDAAERLDPACYSLPRARLAVRGNG